MELSVKITATQLTKGMETFLGQEVKDQKGNPFCFVPANGDNIKVHEDFWLVEYYDGYREVWSTDQLENNAGYFNTTEPDEDVRIDDETSIDTPIATEPVEPEVTNTDEQQ